MFDALTERFTGIFRSLSGKGVISEENIRESMREVRVALLEADVNLQVVNDFVTHVTDQALGTDVIKSLQPGQLMVKLCYDELVKLMGPVDTSLYMVSPGPSIVMMCGLQGSGKTTTTGKLALYLKSKGHQPMLVAADLQRPAAVEQLRVIGRQADVPVYADDSKIGAHGTVVKGAAVAVCRAGIAKAKELGRDIVILDTAGRLAIDEELMAELKDINTQLKPQNVLLVLDSMTGQDAVESAKRFNEQLELDGLILTKLDSDTRGGALLSAKVVTGKPIKFLGIGEKLERLEEFRPEGMAQRILGMGDVVGLVNEAMEKFDMEEQEKLQAKLDKGTFTFEDFINQMKQMKKLGPVSKIMGMIPGMSEMAKSANMNGNLVEDQMKKVESIYNSMSKAERKNPDMLDSQRRRRISAGSGTTPVDVSTTIKQFTSARDMMRAVGGMGMMGRMKLARALTSGNLAGAGPSSLKIKKGGWQEKKDRNKKK
ncbi:MAG TPA: signal recognition particle protein [Tepidisphaeraceae bacterium]|nr:signal recognition particle protein [Tepidisphaeraceae bacterium]